MPYSNNQIKTELDTYADTASGIFEAQGLISKGAMIYLLKMTTQSGGWKTFYPESVKLHCKVTAVDGHDENALNDLIKQLEILNDIYHNNLKTAGNAHDEHFSDPVTSNDHKLLKRDLKKRIDGIIAILETDEEPQNLQQNERKYQQKTSTLEVNETWQDKQDNNNNYIYTNDQRVWLQNNNQLHNQIRTQLYVGNDSVFNVINNANDNNYLNKGITKFALDKATNPDTTDEDFYKELSKLYSKIKQNGANKEAALIIINAINRLRDTYIENNKRFKQQIKTYINNHIPEDKTVKDQKNAYAKEKITPNHGWQAQPQEDLQLTEAQRAKLPQPELLFGGLPSKSQQLIAIYILKKFHRSAPHQFKYEDLFENEQLSEDEQRQQRQVNRLCADLHNATLKHNGKLTADGINQTLADIPRLRNISINFENAKEKEIIEKALIPNKVKDNVFNRMQTLIKQIDVRNEAAAIALRNELQAQNPNAQTPPRILNYMQNARPHHLDQLEFLNCCRAAVRQYIAEHLAGNKAASYPGKRAKRQQQIESNTQKLHDKTRQQELIKQAYSTVIFKGLFDQKTYEKKLDDLIEDNKFLYYETKSIPVDCNGQRVNRNQRVETKITHDITLPELDGKNPIIIKTSFTKKRANGTHGNITTTIPNIAADCNRTAVLLWLTTLKKSGIKSVNLDKLDYKERWVCWAYCKACGIETADLTRHQFLADKLYTNLTKHLPKQQQPTSSQSEQQKMFEQQQRQREANNPRSSVAPVPTN